MASWLQHLSAFIKDNPEVQRELAGLSQDMLHHVRAEVIPALFRNSNQLQDPQYIIQPSEPEPYSPYRVLGLHDNAPIEVVEAVYRTLAKTLRPDLGRNKEKWQQISQAYQEIKAKR